MSTEVLKTGDHEEECKSYGEEPKPKRLNKLKKALKRTSKPNYLDDTVHSTPGRIFFILCWILATALTTLYTYEITTQYLVGQQYPQSSVSIFSRPALPLPEVIVCNLNTDKSNNSSSSCYYCTLQIEQCLDVNTSADCTDQWHPYFVVVPEVGDAYNCYTFNSDPNNVIWSHNTGYSGAYIVIFKLNIPSYDYAPTAVSPRIGAQVTFGVQNQTTPLDLYNEVRYSQINTDTFYRLTATNTIHADLSPSNPNYNTSYFTTVSSSTTLVGKDNETGVGYLSVSFAFQNLNLEVIQYSYTFTLANYFGQFSGFLNLLFGISLVKVMSAIPLSWIAWKMRSCRPIEDRFLAG